MSRFLAVEWDSREARIAVASAKGSEVLVEHLLTVPLAFKEKEEGKEAADPQIGETLAAAMNAAGIRGVEALVSVGRASIELKQLTLPPVPDEELPDMVRLQATREFHSLGEDWPLDYLPLAGTESGRQVLAAALSPDMVRQFQQTCTKAGLDVKKLILRPSAAASLFLRSPDAAQEEVRLLVDLLPEDADLSVLVGRDAVFLRTARLPHESIASDNPRPLLAELRRTLAAAHNQLAGRKVQAIYVFGNPAEHAAVAERIEKELGLPVRLFDPLAGLQLGSALKSARPANTGRFAPLLGMLADELQQTPHGIDFLHPRRTPEAPSKRNTYVLAVAAAAALVLLGTLFGWQRLAALDRKIAERVNQSNELNKVVKSADAIEKSVADIKKWTNADIVWLDELRQLSERFPESKEAMLTHLRVSPSADGGSISMEGLVREPSTIDSLEQALRDDFHTVKGEDRRQERQNKTYQWQFKSAVIVKARPATANPETKGDSTAAREEISKR